MSLASPQATTTGTRAAIVEALNTVAGLTAYQVVPDQATSGAAWPRWVQTTYDGALCRLSKDTYEIYVTLPAAYLEDTVDQGDAFRDPVAMALIHLGRVEYAEPVQIQFQDQQAMPGLRLRLTIT